MTAGLDPDAVAYVNKMRLLLRERSKLQKTFVKHPEAPNSMIHLLTPFTQIEDELTSLREPDRDNVRARSLSWLVELFYD